MDKLVAIERLQELVGQYLRALADLHNVTVWKNGKLNKGWAGHTVERHLGLPINSSRDPNLGGWELKLASLTWDKDGLLVPKETMAITMLDPYEVRQKEFYDSHLFTKLRKIVAVARVYESRQETRSICKHVHAFDLEETALLEEVARDYEDIRQTIMRHGFESLTGKMGQYVQPRTKGPGHGSTSRAFYARKGLVRYIIGMDSSPRTLYDIPAGLAAAPLAKVADSGGQPYTPTVPRLR